MFAITKNAISDISSGFRLWRVWVALAQEDIGDQHRRTVLGPLWLLINYLIYVGTFIVLFGPNAPISDFTAYVSVGMLIFLFLQEVVILSISLYVREESFIAGTTLPMTVYILRLTTQSLIRTGYATLGCLGILFLAGTPVTVTWLWSLLGIIVILVALPAIITVLATAGAFFPDLQFVVTNLIRVSMFLTPIFWVKADGLRGHLYLWNPLTHFIEIVRTPIVMDEVPLQSLGICITIVIVTWIAALISLGTFRKRVIFYL